MSVAIRAIELLPSAVLQLSAKHALDTLFHNSGIPALRKMILQSRFFALPRCSHQTRSIICEKLLKGTLKTRKATVAVEAPEVEVRLLSEECLNLSHNATLGIH